MKPVRSIPTALAALSCVLVLPIAAGACGAEAPIPTNVGGASTGGTGTVATTGGSAGSGVATSAGTPSVGGSTGGVSTTGAAGSTSPTSGTGPSAGTSSGGATTTGGATTGGATTGGATTGGATTGGAAGGATDPSMIADTLNGQMLKGPCQSDFDPLVCKTGNCTGQDNADFALSGALTTDKTITIAGDPAKTYTITLHIQGEVEAKSYGNTGDQEKSKQSPMADGFQVGGTPTKGDAYNVYMLRVTSPKQDYFFNSLIPPGVSDHTTYGIDYTAQVKATGGTTMRLVAADRNCSMIKNCGPNNNGGTCNAPITIANVDPVAKAKNPTFNFNEPFNGQWVSIVVTAVTAN
jgi:hypothetical protein